MEEPKFGVNLLALDQRAEKAYADLGGERQQQICQKIFKALTDGTDARGIRRPTGFATLCALADASLAEVMEVIDIFRKPSRLFVMPPLSEGSLDQAGAWANGIGQALTAAPPATSPATLTPQQYTVQSGDTLRSIAQRFYGDSTLWTLIQAANPEIDPNNLQIGQQLQIPFGQQHTVQSGDTLNNIAQRVYNNSSWWPLIQDANPGINPNNLQIGQLLQIPFGLQYTVQSGDTLAGIAQRFYGDSSQWTLIQNANPGINPNNLQIGQLLLILFGQQYTVQSGDTLVKIAEQFYGNGSQWTLIQNANPGINPNNLQVGQQLQIPAN